MVLDRRRVLLALVDAGLAAVALADALLLSDASAWVVACGVLAAGGVLVRRRAPYLTAATALLGLFVAGAAVAVVVVLYTLAVGRTPRPVLAAVSVAALVGQAAVLDGPRPADLVALDVIYALLFVAGPVALGLLVRARDELTGRLADLRAARADAELAAAHEAVAEERAQLAREMHDVVSHQVSLIAVRAGALQVTAHDPDAVGAARDIRALSVTTLEELRQMVRVLRAGGDAGPGLSPQPRIADLGALVQASGTVSTYRVEVPEDLPAAVQRAVYRTVQEGLTNARKHANGSTVDVSVVQRGAVVEVVVDNGPGRAPSLTLPGSGHGLLGLRERAEMLTGVLEAGPTPERGFRLRALLPVRGGG